jgi:hypothetical protein
MVRQGQFVAQVLRVQHAHPRREAIMNQRGSLLVSDAGTQLSRGRITIHTDAL